MVCAVHTGGNRNRSTANTSMILTARRGRRGALPHVDPFRRAPRTRNHLITGTASHLNHVPDATCHIGGRRGPAGMRVAYITGKRGDVALGKEASKRILIKRGFGMGGDARRIPRVYRTTIRTTPPHTSRRQITPRQAGFFFACVFLEVRAAARPGGSGGIRSPVWWCSPSV